MRLKLHARYETVHIINFPILDILLIDSIGIWLLVKSHIGNKPSPLTSFGFHNNAGERSDYLAVDFIVYKNLFVLGSIYDFCSTPSLWLYCMTVLFLVTYGNNPWFMPNKLDIVPCLCYLLQIESGLNRISDCSKGPTKWISTMWFWL